MWAFVIKLIGIFGDLGMHIIEIDMFPTSCPSSQLWKVYVYGGKILDMRQNAIKYFLQIFWLSILVKWCFKKVSFIICNLAV